MSYKGQGALAIDADFRLRVAACAATQGIQQADRWAADNAWILSAAPGFAEAYSYAQEIGIENPGGDGAVVTDEAILSAVQQKLLGQT